MKTKTCPHCKWHVTTGKNKVVILCDRHAAVDELVEVVQDFMRDGNRYYLESCRNKARIILEAQEQP